MNGWWVTLLMAAVLLWPSRSEPPFVPAAAVADPNFSTLTTVGQQLAGPPLVGRGRSVDEVAVAGAMDLLALALEGGAGLVEALEAVTVELGGALGKHLAVISAAMRWGMDEDKAWASLPAAWDPAARALSMAALSGVPPAGLLVQAAADLRRAEEQRLEVAASRLGVLLVLPLGLAFLPAFVLMTVVPVVLALASQVLSGA